MGVQEGGGVSGTPSPPLWFFKMPISDNIFSFIGVFLYVYFKNFRLASLAYYYSRMNVYLCPVATQWRSSAAKSGRAHFFSPLSRKKWKAKKKKGGAQTRKSTWGGWWCALLPNVLKKTTVLCSISIKLYWKGGLEVLPRKIFTVMGTKLGNSRHF